MADPLTTQADELAGYFTPLAQAIKTGNLSDYAWIKSCNRTAPDVRLNVYVSGYRQRLIEALRGEYPLVRKLTGATAFDLFALGYVEAMPPHSYTLYDLGQGFAHYLEMSRPALAENDALSLVPSALARIERAKAEVARASGLENIPTGWSGDPVLERLFAWANTSRARHFRCPDSVRLLHLPFDFTAVLAAPDSESLPLPYDNSSYLAVARLDYHIQFHHLTDWQFAWLQAASGGAVPLPDVTADFAHQAQLAGLIVPV